MARRSKVELSQWVARHYDVQMDLLFLGNYRRFIADVIDRMKIRREDEILDLGSGTGRNVCLMENALGPTGRVVGVDINQEMLRQAHRRCRLHAQVTFLDARIEEPLPFHGAFDKVCLFFVLHGFEDDDKERILANAKEALRPGGVLWVLDYDEFDLEKSWFPLRWVFTHVECELAVEFLILNLKEMLIGCGFRDFMSYGFFSKHVRLLGARK